MPCLRGGRGPAPPRECRAGVAHPWLRDMIETMLAGELSALPSAIVIPLGRANRALAHLQDRGAVDPARCLIGLPHPSPASPLRERYFQDAKAHLLSQVRHLAPDAAPSAPARPQPQNPQLSTVSTPSGRPCPRRAHRQDRDRSHPGQPHQRPPLPAPAPGLLPCRCDRRRQCARRARRAVHGALRGLPEAQNRYRWRQGHLPQPRPVAEILRPPCSPARRHRHYRAAIRT